MTAGRIRWIRRCLITAMREQLGLSLKSQDAMVDFLVIDSAEKVAAGN